VKRERLMRASEWWFRTLVRLYSPDFRDDMGDGVVETYRDRAHEALNRGGIFRLAGVWIRAFGDSLRNGPGERLRPAALWRRGGNWGRDAELATRRLLRAPGLAVHPRQKRYKWRFAIAVRAAFVDGGGLMAIGKRDREFRLPKISYLDFKQLEMDRVLTALFMRLAHNGFPSRLNRRFELTVESFTDEFLGHPEWFSGFQLHREVLERWVETHLMDVVNRGKSNQAVAAPRPLHGFTYRFRNPKHSRDYGAAQHIYEMLYNARHGSGQKALDHLKAFFFQGHDRVTGQPSSDAMRAWGTECRRQPRRDLSPMWTGPIIRPTKQRC
jgi:hypothetical protein